MKKITLSLLPILTAIFMFFSSAQTPPKPDFSDGVYAYSSYPDIIYFGPLPLLYWPQLDVADFSGNELNPSEDCDSGCELVCAAFIANRIILTIYSKSAA